jgi:hypothetical protein
MALGRCTECRKWFAAAVTAREHQCVCGPECRRQRRNKLARRRRRSEIEEHRADERARQQKRRDAARGADRHEPGSDGNYAELLGKLQQVVDNASRLSRATFRRAARRILRKNSAFASVAMDGAGVRHELPSEPGPAENGSRWAPGGDGVTDRDGV